MSLSWQPLWLGRPIDVPSVPQRHNDAKQDGVLNGVNDPVVTGSDAVRRSSHESPGPGRPRICC